MFLRMNAKAKFEFSLLFLNTDWRNSFEGIVNILRLSSKVIKN